MHGQASAAIQLGIRNEIDVGEIILLLGEKGIMIGAAQNDGSGCFFQGCFHGRQNSFQIGLRFGKGILEDQLPVGIKGENQAAGQLAGIGQHGIDGIGVNEHHHIHQQLIG